MRWSRRRRSVTPDLTRRDGQMSAVALRVSLVLPVGCQICGMTRHDGAHRPPQIAPTCENSAGRRKGGGLRRAVGFRLEVAVIDASRVHLGEAATGSDEDREDLGQRATGRRQPAGGSKQRLEPLRGSERLRQLSKRWAESRKSRGLAGVQLRGEFAKNNADLGRKASADKGLRKSALFCVEQ